MGSHARAKSLTQIHKHAHAQSSKRHGFATKRRAFGTHTQQIYQQNRIHSKNVLPDLEGMILAARKDGVNLRVVSAFRSYHHQKNLWQRKWRRTSGNDKARLQAVLRYSSPPAFSRHHWGSDVDLNSLKLTYWASADGKKTQRWLQKNARKFGFCQVYSQRCKSGHREEKWHWSHVRSARPYYHVRAKNIKRVKHINLSGSRALTPELLKTYLSSIQNCGL